MREEYVSRINRVLDYIEANLDRDLSLEALADVASFSRFHFHRVFRAMVGETLNQFIQRRRVEKAASQLTGNPKKTITEIALDCGFSGSATFARAFRDAFGVSASEWRSMQRPGNSKIRKPASKTDQTPGKIGKDLPVLTSYPDNGALNLVWRMNMTNGGQARIEVKEMPELHVAYVRHIGPYQGDSELFGRLFEKLMTWAGPRGLLRVPETQVLSVYYDDPDITDEEKLRVDACITVPDDTAVEGEVGKMTIPGGRFAVARFELGPDDYGEAWNMVMGSWLPQSGYQPDDRLCYELYHNNPEEHPERKSVVDICVPVRPL